GAAVRHPPLSQPERMAVLRSGGDGDLYRPVERRHLDAVAESRLHEVHAQLVDRVVVAPRQLGVRPHAQAHVQVARLAATNSGLALARQPDLGSGVDPCRNANREPSGALNTAVAGARVAWALQHAAGAPAGWTGCRRHHRAEDRLLRTPQLPGASRSEEHTSELQSRVDLVCRLLLEKKKE